MGDGPPRPPTPRSHAGASSRPGRAREPWPPPLPGVLSDLAPRAPWADIGAAWAGLCAYLRDGSWASPPTGLLAELEAVAALELSLLGRGCRGSRLRAAAGALAILRHLLEVLPPLRSGSPPPGGPAPRAPGEAPDADAAVRSEGVRALGLGFSQAEGAGQLAEELQRLAPWAAWHSRGSVLEQVVLDHLEDLSRLLDRRPELRRIADELGKLEAESREARGLERGGRTAVVGVRVGGELAHVLPSELALLADAETEDLFYARLLERRLLALELEGPEQGSAAARVRPGAVIACVDTSGSMRGHHEVIAKAALLAVARRVLGAGRRMVVMIFGGRGAITEIALRPGHVDLDALFRLLMTSYYGGTDFDGPIRRALRLRESEAALLRADLLLLTDGLCRLGAELAQAVAEARGGGLEVVSVVIGGATEAVAPLSDVVWCVDGVRRGAPGLRAYE